MRVFVAAHAPKPRMLVFGAIDFAAAVARWGASSGYYVTVCDARPVFATKTRFPGADEVIVQWPHDYLRSEVDEGRIDSRTVIAVLTHDPKFDVPLLEEALRLPDMAYIGAMGSRRTHDDRLDRLREAGLTDDELARPRARSGSTSAPAPRRRPPSRSRPRSSRCSGAAVATGSASAPARSTTTHWPTRTRPGSGPGQTREGEPAAYQS